MNAPSQTPEITCAYALTLCTQLAGTYHCGTNALACVLNALQPTATSLNEQTHVQLDRRLRRWQLFGIAPQLLVNEARHRGLFAQAYNNGTLSDLSQHLSEGHLVIVFHRVYSQYHYEVLYATGYKADGTPYLTLTHSEAPAHQQPAYQQYDYDTFCKTHWHHLRWGVGLKRGQVGHPLTWAQINIPTGHNGFYLVFSKNHPLPPPTWHQHPPLTNALATWINHWGNAIAPPLKAILLALGLKTLCNQWFTP
ncbi:MAG: hypothetical protein U0003_03985 [Vampirovibrionales bacterium]